MINLLDENNRFLSYSLVREERNEHDMHFMDIGHARSWLDGYNNEGVIWFKEQKNSNKFLWILIVMHMLTWMNEVSIYILITFINK